MSATIFTGSKAGDDSIFDHFGGATNKTCYYLRHATIAMSSNQSNDECINGYMNSFQSLLLHDTHYVRTIIYHDLLYF